MATGPNYLIAEVLAERIDLRVRLYLTPGRLYRVRCGSGLGWAPGSWRSEADGMKRLLACASYGPDELRMLRAMCRENP